MNLQFSVNFYGMIFRFFFFYELIGEINKWLLSFSYRIMTNEIENYQKGTNGNVSNDNLVNKRNILSQYEILKTNLADFDTKPKMSITKMTIFSF